jgi:CheY-like chemotaxis protein
VEQSTPLVLCAVFTMSSQVTSAITSSDRLFEGFENLMPFRVEDILVVSSLYDSFILREDGQLNELLIGDSLELHLQHIPNITHVSSGQEALARVQTERRYNLIVASLELGDMNAAQLAHAIKQAGLDVPVVVLAYDYGEVKDFRARNPVTAIERIFLWQGNVRILITMIKYIEDKRNAFHDTHVMGVPVMLVVEDNIRYYSSFLPVIYTELITQSRHLLSDSINVAHRLMRMRARPKILLSTTYEDAVDQVMRYRDYLMGVVSDVEFPRDGQLSPGAGFELADVIRENVPDVPIVLQSSRTEFQEKAIAQGYQFLRKRSPTLLADLRKFFVEQVGFGDFVFRMPDGTEVARATDLKTLETKLGEVDAESVAYHAERNHFSQWLRARTEFAVAQKLRPRKLSDFAGYEHLRRDLIQSIAEYRREQSEVLIGDFNRVTFQANDATFLRMGTGSLGGKGRGLAFIRHLLYKHRLSSRYGDVRIGVPPSVILATDIFDQFMAENALLDFAMSDRPDEVIVQRFVKAALPDTVIEDLRVLLEQMRYPLAVRSSSLLEDSQYQPFAGVYETFMVSNQHSDLDVRLGQTMEAIKRVYASVFNRHAKRYVQATSFRLEEEKMAVVIQRVVGTIHRQKFYPEFSGVVRSRNFYPAAPMKPEDGIAAVGLGLGRTVVEGGKCVRFCPRYPRHMLQFSSVEEILANTQSSFWAMDVGLAQDSTRLREVQFPLAEAERDGTLRTAGSTFCVDNHAVYDGIGRAGTRVVTFAPVLKHGLFPLAPILEELSTIGEKALGRPVEIEFAVRLPRSEEDTAEFGVLQMRPLVLSREVEDVALDDVPEGQTICQSNRVLGNGRTRGLHDAIVVDFHRFDRGRSQEVAQAVAYFNSRMMDQRKPYLLIGVGRWGSNDPWLGIPVTWDQIAGAKAIVEAGFRDFRVMPSQGSHFFQNLTSFQVGYFTVNPDAGEGFIDWAWLAALPAQEERNCVRHLRFADPLELVMNGKAGRGVIFKPVASGQ